MSDILLKCGHTANAQRILNDGSQIPSCVICNCSEVAENTPDLTGRKARCSYCSKQVDSSLSLAFFAHTPNKQYDEYYCGCYGWN